MNGVERGGGLWPRPLKGGVVVVVRGGAVSCGWKGEVPQDPKIFMYCGISNLKLGYGIIAEQMFKRAVVYPEVVNEAKKNLAIIYQD